MTRHPMLQIRSRTGLLSATSAEKKNGVIDGI
jgi:hypothetical protein